jgi:hypothetical protein
MFESIHSLFKDVADRHAGKHDRHKAVRRRKLCYVRLGVERLEERALLAADVPGYTSVAVGEAVSLDIDRSNASGLDGYGTLAPTSGQTLYTSQSFAYIADDMALTPKVWDAMEDLRMGRATAQQRALLFVSNDIINKGRLNGWITDAHYQAAQTDFKLLNENFAGRAATDVGGEFKVQLAKKTVFSPGTDSDYIIKVKSGDPVGDVRSMQRLYNTNVNRFLELSLGTQQARAFHRTDWHNRLDVDFMVDPKYVSAKQFKEIAELNNAAYSRRLAADYERVSRTPFPERISDAHFRDYAVQMRDLESIKRAHIEEIRANPAKLRTSGPILHQLMALEQKYIERIEAANVALRKQAGLPIAKPPYAEPHWEIRVNAKGETVMTHRTSETIAARGAVRDPANFRMTSTASSLAPLTGQRALSNLAESMVEANVKNARSGTIVRNLTDVGQDVGKMVASLPDAEKGRLIETLRRQHGDKVAAKIVEGMRKEYKTTPGNPLDNKLKNALGVSDDVRQMSSLRRSVNEFAGKTLKIVQKLGRLGDFMLLKDALTAYSTYVSSMAEAWDPNLTSEEREALLLKAEESALSMAQSGGMGVLFARVPTLGAAYVAWTVGYTGGRFILENTAIGQWIDFQADQYAERLLASYDAAYDKLTELLGGTSEAMARQDQLFLLEGRLIKLLKEGKVTIKEGMTALDVLSSIRKGDLWALDEMIQVKGAIPVEDVKRPTSMRDPQVLKRVDKQIIDGFVEGNNNYFKISLNAGDYLQVRLEYLDAPGRKLYPIIQTDWTWVEDGSPNWARDHDGTGQITWINGEPAAAPANRYTIGWKVTKAEEVVIAVDDDTNYIRHPELGRAAYSLTVSLNGANVAKTPATPPVSAGDWYNETIRLNGMSASQAAQELWKYDWKRRVESLNRMTSQRASEVLWTRSWSDLTAALNQMSPERTAEVIANYSPTNRTATLDKMTAKRASEVIHGYDTWTERIAALDKMTAKRAAEVIGSYSPTDRTATLDRMSAKRASEVIWNYGWTQRIAELDRMTAKRASEVIWNYNGTNLTATLDRMTAKRASEVIWNYNWTNLTATLDRMTAKRASEVIWNYNWTKLTATLDRMTAKRASEVIWNYNWTNLTATLDRMTAKRAAQVIAQYSSAARMDVLNHLSPARRSEITKLL